MIPDNDCRIDLHAEVARLRAMLVCAGINPDSGVAPAAMLASDQRAAQRIMHHVAPALSAHEVIERYQLAASMTNDAVWDWDLRGNVVVWNGAIEKFYGHALAAIVPTGEWWLEQIHPDDRGRVGASIHGLIESANSIWVEEYRFRRVDGSYAEVLDRGYVIRDTQGRGVRMIGAMLDLTSLRASEAALRKSEERLRTIVETIETAFAIVEVKFDEHDHPVDYRFVHVNPAFERQAGVDLCGKWVSSYAPDLEPFWFETYGRVAKTREPASFENYARNFERWFDVRAVPVGEPEERQIGIFFNDTTERRKAQERLRLSEADARENSQRVQLALAAGAIIGTWNWDLPNDLLTADEPFAIALGLDAVAARAGLSMEEVTAAVHPDDVPGLRDAIDAAVKRGGPYAHQYRVRDGAGGYRWVEANGRVDLSPDGSPLRFPGVLIDVQERRAVQAERDQATAALKALSETLEQQVVERTAALIQAEDKLRQSQKMEAVGQLTGGLAHDFNNLLAGISGALELMAMKAAQGRFSDIERYVGVAQGAAKRAAALTHRLLAFSRRQTLDPRPTDVAALVTDITELIERTVGPGIKLDTQHGQGLWTVCVDAGQLENALLNLCLNARDAMPAGGTIAIETANRCLDTESVKALDLVAGEYLTLTVTDSGTGMTPATIAKAFDPFFTTKPIGQGTGLGLSMIYGFVKQSSGHIRIHSEVGVGTTVMIYLPRYAGEVARAVDASTSNPLQAMGAEKTILIVDDEPTVRVLINEVLGELGFSVIEAADSLAGLKILTSDVQIDLLVTDVGLPGGMNGRQLADAGRQARPDLRTLFITGYAETAAIGDGHLPAGMQVMTKPFSVESFVARVRDLLLG